MKGTNMTNRTEYERFEGEGTRERRLLRQEELILEATETICKVLKETEVSRGVLAARLGKSPSFVSQVLSGDRNLTLRTLSDLADALDARVRIELVQRRSLGRVIFSGQWDTAEFNVVSQAVETRVEQKATYGGVA